MRKRDRYDLPLSAGRRRAGLGRRDAPLRRRPLPAIASKTFAALRLAVIRLRKTNLPVGITVSRGNHAWILTGFCATADPARTNDFKVTSVRVIGRCTAGRARTGTT